MTGEHWKRLEEIYHSARELQDEDRAAYLAKACDSEDLRLQVESLLKHGDLLSLLETAVAPPTTLPDGTLIGPYRIDTRLDAGGMGVVYRATDTRLGRSVAIKIGFVQFSDRFHREARAIASLNHPHVCTLHDIGSTPEVPSFLVMEFVEGDTLEDVLRTGPLPIARAVEIARMIASALANAHERGIVHRDLKPANIKITPQGSVKVLDFGLAKGFPGPPVEEPSDARTTGALTMAGTVLGTAEYMSPEQASGKDADARSDIFSFGAVLYEMLSGQRPFKGQTSADVVAAVIKDTPQPIRSLRSGIPARLEHVVEKCLSKSADARYASATELLKEIETLIKPAPASRTSLTRAVLVTAAALLLAVGGYNAWRSYQQRAELRWLEETAVPEIRRLLTEHRALAARKLYLEAERVAPESKLLYPLADGVGVVGDAEFASSPPGARVYVSDYTAAAGDDPAEWQFLGESPVKSAALPSWGFYRVRFVKDGFAPTEITLQGTRADATLQPLAGAPRDMVWVPETTASAALPRVALPGFWIDRHEVTNRQFKQFLDARGYDKQEFWTEPFVKDGRAISRDEAMLAFHDLSGRVGPAGWSLGAYPEGTADHPVAGVSWYEAAAYAAFAGKALPTAHEWRQAAPLQVNSDILALSNFNAKATLPVGTQRGMSAAGAYDMAGNVAEWTMSSDGRLTYVFGGGWDEPAYMFLTNDARAPFTRTNALGFRTVKRMGAPPAVAFAPSPKINLTARNEKPVGDDTYKEYVQLHRYVQGPLDPGKHQPDRSTLIWTRESVSFNAAYENERMLAHVFLPKNALPPYQAVVMFGGVGINTTSRIDDFGFPFEFLIRAGRAVVIPAFDGTLERGPSVVGIPENDEVDRSLKWYWDLARTVDYLETRNDIDHKNLGFYALSWGAFHAPRLMALERRFKASALVSGGLYPQPRSVDSWNFAPRCVVPTLMISGKHDSAFPYDTNLKPLFDTLGTPPADKEIKMFDGGHANPVTRPETLGHIVNWFDRYLGRVKERDVP